MATITLKINAKTTKTEDDEALQLLAAALRNDGEEAAERLERPAVKKLLKRGVLKVNRSPLAE